MFCFYFIKYEPIRYGNDYEYPQWGEALGFLISLSSMIWVPGYAIYFMLTTPGTWRQVLRKGITPVIKSRVGAEDVKPRDVELNLVENKAEDNVDDEPPPYSPE